MSIELSLYSIDCSRVSFPIFMKNVGKLLIILLGYLHEMNSHVFWLIFRFLQNVAMYGGKMVLVPSLAVC